MSKNKVSHTRIIEVSPIMSYGQSFKSKSSDNYLIHRDILRLQLSQKQGTVSTKTRSEVRGGGKKPWRQKGTGRARAGSSRSPLWKGGGVIFGPKPKKVSLKVNKKERKRALCALLLNRLWDPLSTSMIEEDCWTIPRTKHFFEKYSEFMYIDDLDEVVCIGEKDELKLKKNILLIVREKTKVQKLMTRNLKNVELISASHLNTLALLKADFVVISQEAANSLLSGPELEKLGINWRKKL
jgi:large subunit ribosomal protein L4